MRDASSSSTFEPLAEAEYTPDVSFFFLPMGRLRVPAAVLDRFPVTCARTDIIDWGRKLLLEDKKEEVVYYMMMMMMITPLFRLLSLIPHDIFFKYQKRLVYVTLCKTKNVEKTILSQRIEVFNDV